MDPTITNITLNFEKNNEMGGNGGVNSYGGKYQLGLHNELTFNSISANQMASLNPEINSIESMYFYLLSEVKYYSIKNNTLKLLDKNKNELLILEKD